MSRESFEKWYAEEMGEPNVRRYADSRGVYTHLAMQSAWLGWQAALELQAAQCPHIETSGTTSWCRLAAQEHESYEALEQELSVMHATVNSYSSPAEALKALIDWHVQVALDPKTNGGKVLVSAQPQVPDLIPMEPFQTIDAGSKNYKAGWNACRAAMLTASQEKNKIDRD